MTTKQVRTADLSGPALDWAAAVAEGRSVHKDPMGLTNGSFWLMEGVPYMHIGRQYSPSTKWEQGGPILERENIDLMRFSRFKWRADCGPACTGSTPLVALMRCFVAKRLGDSVEVPIELLGEA